MPSPGQNTLSRFESSSGRCGEPRPSPSAGARGARRRLLVVAQALVRRRAQPALPRPLEELDLADELRLDPGDVARAHPRHLRLDRERRRLAPAAARASPSACRARRRRSRCRSCPPTPARRRARPPGRASRTRCRAARARGCTRRSQAPGAAASSPSSRLRSDAPEGSGSTAAWRRRPPDRAPAPGRTAPGRHRTPPRAGSSRPRSASPPEARLRSLSGRAVTSRPSRTSRSNTYIASAPPPCWSSENRGRPSSSSAHTSPSSDAIGAPKRRGSAAPPGRTGR